MKQGVLQGESMEIYVALMLDGGKQKEHEKTTEKLKKIVEKKRQNRNWNKGQV